MKPAFFIDREKRPVTAICYLAHLLPNKSSVTCLIFPREQCQGITGTTFHILV